MQGFVFRVIDVELAGVDAELLEQLELQHGGHVALEGGPVSRQIRHGQHVVVVVSSHLRRPHALDVLPECGGGREGSAAAAAGRTGSLPLVVLVNKYLSLMEGATTDRCDPQTTAKAKQSQVTIRKG